MVGAAIGAAVGAAVGVAVGVAVGTGVGISVGAAVPHDVLDVRTTYPARVLHGQTYCDGAVPKTVRPGISVSVQKVDGEVQLCRPDTHGWKVGLIVGAAVGAPVGTDVGCRVGASW